MTRYALSSSLLALAFAGAAHAAPQVATPLLAEGDALTGASAGQTITGLNVAGINQVGGYAITLTSEGGLGTLSQAWGSAAGGPGDILLSEQTVGTLVQTSWESSSFGFSDAGEVVYSASGNEPVFGGFDSVWRDATPLAVEADPIATLPGQFWRFASRPKALANGDAVFVAGITATQGGNTENRGLFVNDTALLLGGDSVPGLPFPIQPTGNFSFDFQFSPAGNHWMIEAGMDSGQIATTMDNVMVYDGAGLMVAGALVQEGTTLPAAAGGLVGEEWDNFDYISVRDDGSYLFTGDSNADTSMDEFILVNGVIRWREGDTVDGQILTGPITMATMNDNGDVLYTWAIDDGAGGDLEAMFLNDTLLLTEGDNVDLDGDGLVEPNATVSDFENNSQLSLTNGNVAYFIVDVDTLGTTSSTDDMEVFYRLGDQGLGTQYCLSLLNSSGQAATISASGSDSVAANNLTLSAEGVAGERVRPVLLRRMQQSLPFGDGIRCVGGGVLRLPIQQASGLGTMSRTVDLTSAPSAGNVVGGSTWNYQAWFRDAAAMMSGFNLSDGLSIAFLP